MKQAKYLLMAFIAVCLASSINAQTAKKKVISKKENKSVHYQCPMKCEEEKTYHKNGKCPVCKMQLQVVKKENVPDNYKCPMNCEEDKAYTKPGKCPVCKMDLKQVDKKKSSSVDYDSLKQ